MKSFSFKRYFIPVLIAALVMLAACKGKENTTAQAGASGGTVSAGYAVPVSQGGELKDQFTIFIGRINYWPDDTPMQRVLREQTGINFKAEGIQTNDVQESLNLLLASNAPLGDMLVTARDAVIRNSLINSGRVMELSSLYKSTTLKTIPAIPASIQNYITESDGKKYVIPGWYDQNPADPFPGWTLNAFWVRRDLMEKVGVTEKDFATLDGFENALRKFKTLKDPAGNAVIPMSFIQSTHQENIIAAMFGVEMSNGVSGMPAVMEIGGKQVFSFDNPDFLEAYKWLNRMYREGLIDMEVTTHSAERFQEKFENGQVACYIGGGTQSGFDYWKGLNGPEDNAAKWWVYPFQSPKVSGKTKQALSFVNPYPAQDIFVLNDTKHLNAIMNYLEWVQEPVYYRQQEATEGPVGFNWVWEDDNKMLWRFIPEYEADRSAGDIYRMYSVSPQIWETTSYSKKWYPWFNQAASNLAPGNFFVGNYCQLIGNEIVNHRVINTMDSVQAPIDGVIIDNLPNLQQLQNEYTAKMIMAKDTAACEAAYKEFLQMLEVRANWSGMKAEWAKIYSSAN